MLPIHRSPCSSDSAAIEVRDICDRIFTDRTTSFTAAASEGRRRHRRTVGMAKTKSWLASWSYSRSRLGIQSNSRLELLAQNLSSKVVWRMTRKNGIPKQRNPGVGHFALPQAPSPLRVEDPQRADEGCIPISNPMSFQPSPAAARRSLPNLGRGEELKDQASNGF